MRIISGLTLTGIFLAAGWYGGAKYGAPEMFISGIDGIGVRAWSAVSLLRDRDSDETIEADGNAPGSDTANTSAEVPAGNQPAAVEIPSTPAEEPRPANENASDNTAGLFLCKTHVSNAPPADANGGVKKFKRLVEINGVALLLAPATKACLSSGYGHRGYSPHRGVDYFSDTGGNVLAAGNGTVLEAAYRDDYGNMVVIDHGSGVYTRYAHLRSLSSAARAGAELARGEVLGPIGQTGRVTATHLHFEIRTGDYANPKASFGLTPIDPFSLPAAE